MNRKSRHGQSFRKKVEKNKRERAIQNAKKQAQLKALKRERLNAGETSNQKTAAMGERTKRLAEARLCEKRRKSNALEKERERARRVDEEKIRKSKEGMR